ncbi:hypothetical protein Tco_0578406 [Tanacetum coccineum]
MIDDLSIAEPDKVIHTMETDMVKLVVKIDCFGKSFDEFDKETMSSDGLLPKTSRSECRSCIKTNRHLHEIHYVPSKHELSTILVMQILNQFDICHKFAPLRRKSVQKLDVHLKLFQFHIVDVHVIE